MNKRPTRLDVRQWSLVYLNFWSFIFCVNVSHSFFSVTELRVENREKSAPISPRRVRSEKPPTKTALQTSLSPPW
jgi:hypothetical protein